MKTITDALTIFIQLGILAILGSFIVLLWLAAIKFDLIPRKPLAKPTESDKLPSEDKGEEVPTWDDPNALQQLLDTGNFDFKDMPDEFQTLGPYDQQVRLAQRVSELEGRK